MRDFFKRFLNILCLTSVWFAAVAPSFGIAVIDAEKNAYRHNNRGLNYLSENNYFAAIKEFQIAIDILPDVQASAVFYSNLADTYEKTGNYAAAQKLREKALSLNGLYLDYYIKLARNYRQNGKIDEMIKSYGDNRNSTFNEVLLGVLYVENGQTSTGAAILDDFCNREPALVITPGIRNYLSKMQMSGKG